MFIPVSIRDCRTAIGAAIAAEEAKIAKDTEDFKANSYQRLHDGAVHNGLTPSATELENMRAMVARDVDHAMEGHPGHVVLKVLKNYEAMLAYAAGVDDGNDETVISDEDFSLLGEYLPKNDEEQALTPREKLGQFAEKLGA